MYNVSNSGYDSSRLRSISGSGTADLSAKLSAHGRPTLGSAADMNMRESIITSSHQMKNKTNCIEDWSFLDESILRSMTIDPPFQNASSATNPSGGSR